MNVFGAEDLLRLNPQHRAELAADWPPSSDHRAHRHVHRMARSAFVAMHHGRATLDKASDPNGSNNGRNRSH